MVAQGDRRWLGVGVSFSFLEYPTGLALRPTEFSAAAADLSGPKSQSQRITKNVDFRSQSITAYNHTESQDHKELTARGLLTFHYSQP